MPRIAALMAECEDTTTPDATAEARLIHVQKLTKVKEAVIKVVSHPTGRRADTMHDDGARKARCTTRGYEQTLLSSASDEKHLKMMLVEGALKGHVAAIGDCSGAFNQSLLNPDGTEWQVWIEPRPEAEFGPDNMGEAVSAFPGRMEHRERGTRTVRTCSRVPWRWNNHDTTVACTTVLCHVTNTSRRMQEDTSMTFWCQDRNRTSDAFWRRHETN